jgi:hypothetical protein
MKVLAFMLLVMISLTTATAQTLPREVVQSFEKGNAKGLTRHLNKSIEMNILDQKHTVSRNQAVRILQEFFNEYPPSAFEVTYEGGKADSKYSLCNYQSSKEHYRVHLSFMEDKDERFIFFLSIEKI